MLAPSAPEFSASTMTKSTSFSARSEGRRAASHSTARGPTTSPTKSTRMASVWRAIRSCLVRPLDGDPLHDPFACDLRDGRRQRDAWVDPRGREHGGGECFGEDRDELLGRYVGMLDPVQAGSIDRADPGAGGSMRKRGV